GLLETTDLPGQHASSCPASGQTASNGNSPTVSAMDQETGIVSPGMEPTVIWPSRFSRLYTILPRNGSGASIHESVHRVRVMGHPSENHPVSGVGSFRSHARTTHNNFLE